jgi:hypothetical protein
MEEPIGIEEILDQIKTKLITLTEGEEDPELQQYNEYLIDNIDIIYQYITLLEEEITEKHEH